MGASSMMIIGHRGCREAPATVENTHDRRGRMPEMLPVAENSLEAFTRAIDSHGDDAAGADAIELDCWRTADGVVVVHHDSDLSRLTRGTDCRRIEDVHFTDLPALCYNASTSGSDIKTSRIPTLEEVLTSVDPSTMILVELKGRGSALVDGVYYELKKSSRLRRVWWFSLDSRVNKLLRQKDPSIPIISSAFDVLQVVLLFWCGLFCFADTSHFDIFGLPLTKIDVNTFKNNFPWMPSLLTQAFAYVFGGDPCQLLANASLVRVLKNRNIPTFCLGGDNECSIDALLKMKPAAVVTYRPHWARRQIQEKEGKGCL